MPNALLAEGRRYHNPTVGDTGHFEVLKAGRVKDSGLVGLAERRLKIRHSALMSQLVGYTPEEVSQEVNPGSEDEVKAEVEKLKWAQAGNAVYVHAHALSEVGSGQWSDSIVGIGRAKFEDWRAEGEKAARPDPPASQNLINIGGVYVLEDWQNRGMGLAMVDFMIEALREINPKVESMPTGTQDFPQLNPRMDATLYRYGFERDQHRRDMPTEFCGRAAMKRFYVGPPGGELQANLRRNQEHAFLDNWQTI